jgi:hypothetical protein
MDLTVVLTDMGECSFHEKQSFPTPNWVLRTAIGPASLAGQRAVRITRAQH